MSRPAARPVAVPPILVPPSRAPGFRLGTVLLGLAGLAGLGFVYCFDPTQTPVYPVCSFHRLTGWNCPGCGATRAVYALLHGRWAVAWHDNALLLLTLAALLGRAVWLAGQRWRGRPAGSLVPTSALLPWLVLAGIFGVVRNLPCGACLAPL
jgi:hypothetical protein